MAFRKDRLLKLGELPAAPAIHTDLNLRDAPAAAPRQPSNLMKARMDLLLP